MSVTRYYEETECEHGNDGICDHIPSQARGGGCMRLDCNVLHGWACPGGQRRELTGVQVVDWCVVHNVQPHAWHRGNVEEGGKPCRIVSAAIIPLEEPE